MLFFLASLIACDTATEASYVIFNNEEDTVVVSVGGELEQEATRTDLHSSTGEVVVGWAEVRPGGGPVGTEHEIVVVVDDEYEDYVERVSIGINAGERGEDEYDLTADSADKGYYKTVLVTVGDDDEQRADEVTFKLWETEEETVSTEEETSDESN